MKYAPCQVRCSKQYAGRRWGIRVHAVEGVGYGLQRMPPCAYPKLYPSLLFSSSDHSNWLLGGQDIASTKGTVQDVFRGGVSAPKQPPHPTGRGKGAARGAAAHKKTPKTPQQEPRHARAPAKHQELADARTSKIEGGTERGTGGNGEEPKGKAAAEIATRRQAAALVKDFASVENVSLAFGLQKSRQGGDRSFGDGGPYGYGFSTHTTQYSASTAGGGSSRGKADGDEERDLEEASFTIANPLFGDTTRAVGRQPKNSRAADDR